MAALLARPAERHMRKRLAPCGRQSSPKLITLKQILIHSRICEFNLHTQPTPQDGGKPHPAWSTTRHPAYQSPSTTASHRISRGSRRASFDLNVDPLLSYDMRQFLPVATYADQPIRISLLFLSFLLNFDLSTLRLAGHVVTGLRSE